MVDLEDIGTLNVQALVRLIRETGATNQREFRIQGGQLFEHCLEAFSLRESAPLQKRESVCFQPPASGGFANLAPVNQERRTPIAGQAEIAISAAPVNFRDAMQAAGMLPDEALEGGQFGRELGVECVGKVVRVGSDSDQSLIGKRVIVFDAPCFANYLTTSINSLIEVPECSVRDVELASLAIPFVTAWRSLVEVARIQPGETVLIQGAAGGVGMTAIQIAKDQGAIVYATANGSEKHDLLRLIGVEDVFDSRSLTYVEAVLEVTDGQGVDVILSSSAGEAIRRNADLLKPGGRWIEIGKRGLFENSQIGMLPFKDNLTFSVVDIDQLGYLKPKIIASICQTMVEGMISGRFSPALTTEFPLSRAREAMRMMYQSKHLGRIVLVPDENFGPKLDLDNLPKPPEGTWIVTGGITGFGLEIAKMLASNGITELALWGRRGKQAPGVEEAVTALTNMGARVDVQAVDVTQACDVGRALEDIREQGKSIRGIVHAAGVIDDGLATDLTLEQIHRVVDPKVKGAWHLHQHTVRDEIQRFVVISSISAAIGNFGQSHYAAANAWLDGFMSWRRGHGLPGHSLACGGIGDVGMVKNSMGAQSQLEANTGMNLLPAAEYTRVLEALLAADEPHAIAATVDWRTLASKGLASSSEFDNLVQHSPKRLTGSENRQVELREMSASARFKAVCELVQDLVGPIVDASSVDLDASLSDLGMDSLMSVELGVALEREVGFTLPTMELLNIGSGRNLAKRIAATLEDDS